ncbi:F-box protein, partial [Trifolium medium]|nr:F-box protein [Trifolium medium]
MSTNDSFSNHKLCGFLSTVLTSHHFNDAQFNDRCEIFNDGNTIAFRTQNGVVLSPIV